jgi:hypothetical protein
MIATAIEGSSRMAVGDETPTSQAQPRYFCFCSCSAMRAPFIMAGMA